MPVVLERPVGSAATVAHVKVRPTRAGEAHAVTQLGDTEQASADRWKTMPPLSTVNMVETLKPGATALLSATDDRRRERVVLAYRALRARQVDRVSRCRTRGSGRCTRRSASRIRRTRTSGGSCCAGWWTACPTRSSRAADRSRRAGPAGHADRGRRRSAIRRAERRQRRRARDRRRPGKTSTCRCSGRASATASTARRSRPTEAGWYEAKLDATARASRSAPSSRTSARCQTMRSTSMRRCTRRC